MNSPALLPIARLSCIFAVCFLAAALLYGCGSRPRHASTTRPSRGAASVGASLSPLVVRTQSDQKRYVGSDACRRCHLNVFKDWSQSAHADALGAVTQGRFGKIFRDPQVIEDRLNGVSYRVEIRRKQCLVTLEQNGITTGIPALVAVGAGRVGTNFLGKDQLGRWVSIRIAHYTLTGHWDYAPQQSPDLHGSLDPAGDVLASRDALESCLSCHVTTLVMSGGDPDVARSHLGVDCERCHGPGWEHVAAMESPSSSRTAPMARLENAPASQILALCAPCHNSPFIPTSATPTRPEDLARFQTTAFTESRCYRSSRSFSCVTCHNPHSDASQDDSTYEAACLSCHAAGAASTKAHARVCKVSPRTDCIRCHMPSQTDPTAPNTVFHNHWIRVWPGIT